MSSARQHWAASMPFTASNMGCWQLLSFLLPLLSQLPVATAQTPPADGWPIQDTGFTDAVQWDHYGFIINGKRVFLFGGEMHPFRIPVPEVWEDIAQKTKAMGLNTLTFYTNWFFHMPRSGSTDFEHGAHEVGRLLEYAKEAGLFVGVRPGPYINAELNAGGFPLWVTTGAYGELRDDNASYAEAWTPYQDGIAQIVAPYQIHENGTVISYQLENEFPNQWTNAATKQPDEPSIRYMEALRENARKNGIDVPLTHNSPNLNDASWSKDQDTVNAGGDVDVLGVDNYPLCWSCNLEECTGYTEDYDLKEYYSYFQTNTPNQPSFMPEFQGGRYNPLDGDASQCLTLTGPEFRNLYYRHNIDQKITSMIMYMLYGGTSWGWMAAPFVGTSYDYQAAIAEDRTLRDSWYETKNLALFTRVAEDLRKADRVGNRTSYTTNADVTATELRNSDTGAAFYITRHADSNAGTNVTFQLHVTTSIGNLTVPQKGGEIAINGRESKIVVTDFRFSEHKLIYSTAEVFTYVVLDGKPTLALWVPNGEGGEFLLETKTNATLSHCTGCSNVNSFPDTRGLVVSFSKHSGMAVLEIGDTRVLILDRSAAYKTFAPVLTSDPHAPANETILVQGPYLVRTAKTDDSSTLALTGDTDAATSLEIFAAQSIESVSWNGASVNTKRTAYGSLLAAALPGPAANITLPSLRTATWKVRDSLPEIHANYTVSPRVWKLANDSTTPSQFDTALRPYLYIDQYGFHVGAHIWRATFPSTAGTNATAPTGVFLALQGGTGFGWSAWLNGHFIGSHAGDPKLELTNATLSFANASLSADPAVPNVLTILQDNSGHEQRSEALEVRGVLNATLLGGAGRHRFSEWRVAGTAGYAHADSTAALLDPVRGAYNEGGLAGERLGWHLPGYDDAAWATSSPATGFAGAGVRFYRTNVRLDIPDGHDASVYVSMQALGASQAVRALLFVNGYQYGRFRPAVSTAVEFAVPPGVLNFGGANAVVVAVWAQEADGARVDVEWRVENVVRSGFNTKFDAAYLQPGWDERRLGYL